MSAPLRFFFVGGAREWRPLDGHETPDWAPFQFRSLPGNVVACARTETEAARKLQGMLEVCFRRAGSAEKWYKQAMESRTQEDLEDLAAVCVKWFGTGRDFEHVDLHGSPPIDVATVVA